mmetsp:Transcript_23357/g.20288  ORF Transcript_23357/g.20288 Transcript_23357/m.20288 type:complete len:198 (-) Transcript_23357:708-1301(-)
MSSGTESSQDQQLFKTKVIQGRYIVHPRGTRNLEIHEVYAHNPAGVPGEFNKGSFSKIKDLMGDYHKGGLNALYLLGVFENDKVFEDEVKKKKMSKKKGFNPLAVTSRNTVNSLLGGAGEFKKVVKTAKEKKIRVVVDALSRISSSHPNRKYRKLLLNHIDDEGKMCTSYGGEGRSDQYEDTIYLNYRKKTAWDLTI